MPIHLTSNDTPSIKTKVYVSGVIMPTLVVAYEQSTTASGKCVFDLRQKDAGGARIETPIFAQIYSQASNFTPWGTNLQLHFENLVLAVDRKSCTVDVKTIGLSVGVLSFTAAPNGVTVTAQIAGQ